NPECEFVQGDMRSFSLGRTFDAVFIDDAIAYMTSREDLGDALSAARRHLNPGGVMIVTPDATREGFVQNSTSATPASVPEGVSGIDAAFVENSYDPDPGDDTYETTMVFLIREEGRPRVEVDRHVLGLFGRDAWRGMLAEAGFVVTEKEYSESGSDYLTFACLRPPV
ncbi:MAG TPA: class I SAM-dependent methyltransferase, partial [Candidatus Fermentibacter sp.]|nr:class I SAM-dependent methyltransferase [Candidatus Fermentibacter sp.]